MNDTDSSATTEDELAHEKAAVTPGRPFSPGRPWELRQHGGVLHRFSDVEGGPTARKQAEDMAFRIFGRSSTEVQKTVTVVPEGEFVVHSSHGFVGSYATSEEANKAAVAAQALLERRAKHAARRQLPRVARRSRSPAGPIDVIVEASP